jgi:hypothetical protein
MAADPDNLLKKNRQKKLRNDIFKQAQTVTDLKPKVKSIH